MVQAGILTLIGTMEGLTRFTSHQNRQIGELPTWGLEMDPSRPYNRHQAHLVLSGFLTDKMELEETPTFCNFRLDFIIF